MRILITGATGYVGSAVASACADRGHQVWGLARSTTSAQKLEEAGLYVARGDLRDAESVAVAVQKVDAVIHAALGRGADIPEIDTTGTNAILSASLNSNKRVIYTSGVWVLGNTGPVPVAERHASAELVPLVRWRPDIERRVLSATQQGIHATVVRPGIVYGRGGGVIGHALREARRTGVARYVGDGRNHWATVHVDDLADLYVRALETPKAHGTLFHAVSEPSIRVRDIFLALAIAAGENTRAESCALEDARLIVGPVADALTLDQHVSGAHARESLSWSPCAPSLMQEIEFGCYSAAQSARGRKSPIHEAPRPAVSPSQNDIAASS